MVKRTWWIVGVAAAFALAGCTSASGDGPSSSASGRPTLSGTPSVVDLSPSPRPTPSVIDPSELIRPSSTPMPTSTGGVNLAPLPAGLTADQIADANAAVEVYRKYWALSDQALADPGRDWTQQVSAVANGTAADLFLSDISALAQAGRRTTGWTEIEASVTKVDPALVHLTGCVDVSGTDVLDSEGQSVKVPNGPGTYERFPTTTQVGQVHSGAWLVTVDTFDRSSTC